MKNRGGSAAAVALGFNQHLQGRGHGGMESARMEERAESVRIPTNLKARYFFKNEQLPGRDCTVINISLNGAGLAFYARETMQKDSRLSLKLFALGGKATITVDGVVSWVKAGKKDYLCGIKLLEALDHVKQTVLGLC